MDIEVDPRVVWGLIQGNPRFADPFGEPAGYAIVEAEEGSNPGPLLALYRDKLGYGQRQCPDTGGLPAGVSCLFRGGPKGGFFPGGDVPPSCFRFLCPERQGCQCW